MPFTIDRDKAEEQHNIETEKTLPTWIAVLVVAVILLALVASGIIVFSLFLS